MRWSSFILMKDVRCLILYLDNVNTAPGSVWDVCGGSYVSAFFRKGTPSPPHPSRSFVCPALVSRSIPKNPLHLSFRRTVQISQRQSVCVSLTGSEAGSISRRRARPARGFHGSDRNFRGEIDYTTFGRLKFPGRVERGDGDGGRVPCIIQFAENRVPYYPAADGH